MECINFCDLFTTDLFQKGIPLKIINRLKGNNSTRILFGSYFCQKYFLKMGFIPILKEMACDYDIKLTLVIPVISEIDLKKGKEKIEYIINNLDGYIDEITVNDVGMLKYISSHYPLRLNMGRLFFKNPRDLKVPVYWETSLCIEKPFLLEEFDFLDRINSIELDETNQVIEIEDDLKYTISIHYPFCYMSTGNICKFASVNKPIEKKFRPNGSCELNCSNIFERYGGKKNGVEIDVYRIGRAIYSYSERRSEIHSDNVRKIYFPFKEISDFEKARN